MARHQHCWAAPRPGLRASERHGRLRFLVVNGWEPNLRHKVSNALTWSRIFGAEEAGCPELGRLFR